MGASSALVTQAKGTPTAVFAVQHAGRPAVRKVAGRPLPVKSLLRRTTGARACARQRPYNRAPFVRDMRAGYPSGNLGLSRGSGAAGVQACHVCGAKRGRRARHRPGCDAQATENIRTGQPASCRWSSSASSRMPSMTTSGVPRCGRPGPCCCLRSGADDRTTISTPSRRSPQIGRERQVRSIRPARAAAGHGGDRGIPRQAARPSTAGVPAALLGRVRRRGNGSRHGLLGGERQDALLEGVHALSEMLSARGITL